jgi:hypothetical protein
VGDCRHTHVVVFQQTTPAEEIAAFFARTSIQRVIIVGDGMPVGLISRRTLLRWLLNNLLSRRSLAAPAACQPEGESGDEIERAILDLTACVSRLARLHRSDENEPFAPSLVGEATRIQHFVETLLANPRAASSRTGGTGRGGSDAFSADDALPDFLAVGAMAIG